MAEKTAEMLTLKALCAELNVEPRVTREKLRIAVREPNKFPNLAKGHKDCQPWGWGKGPLPEKEARAILQS